MRSRILSVKHAYLNKTGFSKDLGLYAVNGVFSLFHLAIFSEVLLYFMLHKH